MPEDYNDVLYNIKVINDFYNRNWQNHFDNYGIMADIDAYLCYLMISI